LLGPFYHVLGEKTDTSPGASELSMEPRLGSDKSFLKALEEMSVQSGHPELNTVPWVLWGHSGGAIWSNVMTMLHPERVVAAFLRSASADWHVQRPGFRQPEVRDFLEGGQLALPHAVPTPDEGSTDQTLRPVDSSQVWLASLLGEKPDRGNEITWDAEADFESGIGGFIILRDRRGLARLPTAPQDQMYGGPRPLFQRITFHDTPEAPIPEMRYLDTSSHVGEKHTYTVITLNSAGVPSEPSAPATVP
jgi:pimeloyl-ACP methyl ester carboxylesterase